jgi:curved DNA-binding protein CbpA
MEESHIANLIEKEFPGQSLYEIFDLDVSISSPTEAEIKKAYKRKALLYHPDKGGNPEKFKAISCAHAILSNPGETFTYIALHKAYIGCNIAITQFPLIFS